MTSKYKLSAYSIMSDNAIDQIRIMIRQLIVFGNQLHDPHTGKVLSVAKSNAVIRQMIEVTRKQLVEPLTKAGWVTDSALSQLDYLYYEIDNYGNPTSDRKSAIANLSKAKEDKIVDELINWNL